MKVELIGTYGSDETHALSAWTSTSRELDDDKRARIPELLAFLAREGHHTPFEKSTLHFLVTTDIATHIHLLKHRIGVSVNAESARYKELREDKFHVPDDWPVEEAARLEAFARKARREYRAALKRLEPVLGRKRAKESARFYLPYASELTADVSFNFRSFMHFVGLRASEHAQREIRQVAEAMLAAVRATGQFDKSLEAYELRPS